MHYTIFYRGLLSSCNYNCFYCPFAKQKDSKASLAQDKQALLKFIQWLKENSHHTFSLLFIPWGEALIRNYYQQILTTLSYFNSIQKITIQTNLSSNLKWLEKTNAQKISLWTTYHPDQVTLEKFIQQCQQLDNYKILYSVGMVGLKENYKYLLDLRKKLKKSVYLWINAYKDIQNYYQTQDIKNFCQIDPYFSINLKNYSSYNQACYAGESYFYLSANGDIYPCNFIKKKLGNLYQDSLNTILKPSVCSNSHCECYLGHIQLKYLKLSEVYGENILVRVPLEDG